MMGNGGLPFLPTALNPKLCFRRWKIVMRRLKPVVSFDSLLIVAETFSMRQVMYIAHLRLYIHSITLALALYIIMESTIFLQPNRTTNKVFSSTMFTSYQFCLFPITSSMMESATVPCSRLWDAF